MNKLVFHDANAPKKETPYINMTNTIRNKNRDRRYTKHEENSIKISVISDFNKYDIRLTTCMLGKYCSKEPTWCYYSLETSCIMACDEHKKGPMHKISETKCIHPLCQNKPIYFDINDPRKTPKYCKFHMISELVYATQKNKIPRLSLQPPLSLDEYEILY